MAWENFADQWVAEGDEWKMFDDKEIEKETDEENFCMNDYQKILANVHVQLSIQSKFCLNVLISCKNPNLPWLWRYSGKNLKLLGAY